MRALGPSRSQAPAGSRAAAPARRASTAPGTRADTRWSDGALPYMMIAPLVVFIAALAIYPTVLTFIEAFFHGDPLTPPNRFVGFGNFISIFNNPRSARA